jgi:hypothetical protein
MNGYIKIFILFFVLTTNAQNSIKVFEKHFIKSDKILFRISPADKVTFDKIKQATLKVIRFEFENGNWINEKVVEKNLAPYLETDTSTWVKLIRNNKDKAGFVYQTLFQNKGDTKLNAEKRNKQEKMAHNLLMLSCDFDAEIAKACGLFFVDSLINLNASYLYKIEMYVTPNTTKQILEVKLNPSILSVNKQINNLKVISKKGQSILKWKAMEYQDSYSGYNIERSEDSINFTKLNKAPIILFTSQFEKNKEFITYKDSTPKTNKKYYYRIKGINFFGEESSPSNIISNYNYAPINSVPLIDSINVINNRIVFLKWRMENEIESTSIKEYLLMRSNKDNGKYDIIYQTKSQTYFKDKEPLSSNFYKVVAITQTYDSLFSYSRMALIIDTISPAIPKELSANVDKNGNVNISWKKNSEKDFLGYKLFKANSKTEEFVQMNNKFITDTFYRVKLNLRTLTKTIYFAIAAVDNNYNSSLLSVPIEVKRPDTIAPVAPILRFLYPQRIGIEMEFVLSKSEDLLKHVIYRKRLEDKEYNELLRITVKDSISSYIDTTAEQGKTYVYLIKAFDEDNNMSVSKSLSIEYETGFRKKLTNVNYSVDRTLKNVVLNWEYNEKGIEKFILYRSKKNEKATIIKTVDGNTKQYIDVTPNIGNVYEYRIKAVYNNGAESIISDPVIITY